MLPLVRKRRFDWILLVFVGCRMERWDGSHESHEMSPGKEVPASASVLSPV